MQDETNKIISLAEASNITGYTQDYLGFLCRTGKLEGQKIGRNWTTTRSALEQMRFDAELTSGPSQTQEHSSLGGTKIPVKVIPSIVIPSEVEESLELLNQDESKRSLHSSRDDKPSVIPLALHSFSEGESAVGESLSSYPVIPEATKGYLESMDPDFHQDDTQIQNDIKADESSPATFEKTFVVGLPIALNTIEKNDAILNQKQDNVYDDLNLRSNQEKFRGQQVFTTFAIILSVLAGILLLKPALLQDFINNDKQTSVVTFLPNQTEKNKSDSDPNNEGQVLAALSVTEARVTPAVLTQFELEKLIMETLATAESLGFFQGPQGPAGTNGTSGTGPSGPIYIQPYIPSVPTSSNPGGTLAGFTDLSSQRFITEDAIINDVLTVNGTASFAGDVEVTGTITAGGITGTINPGLTEGSVVFQGASGLEEDNAGLFYDDTSNLLGVGTATPTYLIDAQGSDPIISVESTSTNGDAVIRMESHRLGVGNEWTFGPGVGASHQAFAFLTTTGAITAMSLSQTGQLSLGTESPSAKLHVLSTTEQLRLGYDTTNYTSLTTSSTGVTTFSFNGSAPQAIFIPQVDSGSAFDFQDSAGDSLFRIDTSGRIVNVGENDGSAKFNIDATITSATGFIYGQNITVNADNSLFGNVNALNIDLGGAFAGSSSTNGIRSFNTLNSTATQLFTNQVGNSGVAGFVSNSATGHNAGILGIAGGSSSLNAGIFGNATTSANSAVLNIGVVGKALNATNNVGGYFYLGSTTPSGFTSTALLANNGSQSAPIFIAQDNASQVFIIADGGNVGIGSDSSPVAGLTVGDDTGATIASGAGDAYVQNDLEVDGTLTVAGATTYSGALSVITTTSPQLTVGYDSSNKFTTAVASDGGTTWAMLGTDADLNINFAGATDGDFSVNTDDLFVDTSTGRVGIGTATPANKLHVNGGARIDGDTGTVFLGTTATVVRGLMMRQEDVNTFSISHYDPGVAWKDLVLNPYGGNVGIGTATPTVKLEVNGGGSALIGGTKLSNARLSITTESTNAEGLIIQGAASQTQNLFEWRNSSSTGLGAISASGDVGIGTTSPTGKLQVLNNADSSTLLEITNTTAGTSAQAALQVTSNAGYVGFYKYSTTRTTYKTAVAPDAILYNSAGGNITILNDNASGNINFTAGGASTAQMVINNLGNVGIGTSAPLSGKLDIRGPLGTASWKTLPTDGTGGFNYGLAFVQDDSTASGTTGYFRMVNTDGTLVSGRNILGLQIAGGGDHLLVPGNTGLVDMSADNIFRFCGGSGSCITASELLANKIRLSPSFATADALADPGDGGVHFPGNSYFATSTGSVGIGTASPDGKLEIAGNISSAAWGLNGIQLQGTAATFTDSSTAASGTATNAVFTSFGQPTLAASNLSVTTTNAATVYIAAAPAAGTNQTITNAYALWVDAGTSRFDGYVTAPGAGGLPDQSERFGYNSAAGMDGTALGFSASAGAAGVAIGKFASTATSSVAVGQGAHADSFVSTAIGSGANEAFGYGIALGYGATSTTTNQFIAGSNTAAINSVYIGNGVTNTSPVSFILQGSGGSGADVPGASVTIAGGKGTGNAAGGDILFQTSDAGVSSSTLQSLTTKLIVKTSGNVGIGATSPGAKLEVASEQSFSYPTMGLGKGTIHLSPVAATNDDTTAITFGGSSAGTLINSGQAGIYVQSSSAYGTKMYFGTSSVFGTGSEARMMIDQLGNIGIADITPDASLEVVNDGSGDSFLVADTNDGDATPFVIQADGDVGVGTAAPVGKFSVQSGISAASMTLGSTTGISQSLNLDGTGWGMYFGLDTVTGNGWIQQGRTSASTAYNLLLQASGGNVGIGTTGPTEKLSVVAGTLSSGLGALKVSGTFPITSGVTAYGANFDFTTARDSDTSTNYAVNIALTSSYVAADGAGREVGGLKITTTDPGGNATLYGLKVDSAALGGTTSYGVYSNAAFGGNNSYGVYGTTQGGPQAVGVYGESSNTGGTRDSYGGMFKIVGNVTQNAYGVYSSPANAPTITGTYYGMYSTINGATVTGAKAAGLFTDGTTTSTFNNGTYAALFAGGNVSIGSDTSPGAAIVVGSDATMGVANGAGDAYIQSDLEVDGSTTTALLTTGNVTLSNTTTTINSVNANPTISFQGNAGTFFEISRPNGNDTLLTAQTTLRLNSNLRIESEGKLMTGGGLDLFVDPDTTGTLVLGALTTSETTHVIELAESTVLRSGESLQWTTGIIDTAGNVGIGTISPDAKLEIAGNLSSAAWGVNGIQLQATAATYTDSSTGASGTATNAVFTSFGQPTLAASNLTVTTTNAATVYIAAAPAAGTNQTITNAYALWVDSGTSRFDGDVNVGSEIVMDTYGRIYAGTAVSQGYHQGLDAGFVVTPRSGTPSAVGMVVQGLASQAGDLTQWRNSSATVLATVNPRGEFQIKSPEIIGTATFELTGDIDPAASTTVTGTNTSFDTELMVGDRITVSGETRTVTAIASQTSLTVDTAFSDNANDTTPDRLPVELSVLDSSGNIDFIVQDNGNVGVGVATPGYKFDVQTNTASTYAAYFFNDGNDANRYGIQIQGGADDASGTTYYLRALDGDGGEVGYIANTSGTFALTDSSDVRTKTNITNTIEEGLATIMQLRVVDFNRLADPDGPRITGFIAQEVNEVYPKIVNESPNGYLGISKENLIPILVKAMQEQQAELQSVKSLAQSLQGLGNGILQVDSLVVNSHVAFNEDTVGQAKILGTDSKVRISFTKEYEYQPVVTVTPMEFATIPYRVTEVDVTGFTIEFASVIGYDVTFNWHSFGSKEGKLTISDGTKQDIAIIVPQAPNPNVAQIQENNLVVDGSGTVPTDGQAPTESGVIDNTSSPQILEVPQGDSGAGGGNGNGNGNTGLPTIQEIVPVSSESSPST